MKPVAGEYKGIAFFPAGTGTLDQSLTLENKDIMILGQDFGTEKYWNDNKEKGENIITNSTWRNLLNILHDAKINTSSCFFTNAIMGVRIIKDSTIKQIGKSPAFKSPSFINECSNYFTTQIGAAKPKIVIVLGKSVADLLAIWNTKFTAWSKIPTIKKVYESSKQIIHLKYPDDDNYVDFILISHPSMMNSNKNRMYRDKTSYDSEIENIKGVFGGMNALRK